MLWGSAFLAVPFGVSLVKQKRIRVNITAVILIAFVLVFMIPEIAAGQRPTYRLLFAPLAFLLGYNYFTSITEKDIVFCYLVIAIGMAMHVALSIALTISRVGFRTGHIAIFTDIWSRTATTTTGLMSNFVLFLPLFVFALAKRERYYLLVPFSLLGVVFGVLTGNRSTLILFVVATVVGLLVSFFNHEYKISGITITVIIALLLFVLLSYSFNWFGIRRMYDNSYLAYRFSINSENGDSLFQTGRWDTKIKYISKMLDYPWGGGGLHREVGSYAHDIWLDTWSSGGLPAFLLLTVYLAAFIYRVVKFIIHAEEVSTKILFASFLVIIMMQYFVEPILNGAPWLFVSACLLDGLISQYFAQNNNRSVRVV